MGPGQRLPERLSPAREKTFPNLSHAAYQVTSAESHRYNCIAYASDDETRKWDPLVFIPGYFWPDTAIRGHTLDCLISAFSAQQYEVCANGDVEPEFEKVALYVDNDGMWSHVAKQLEDGSWKSKLGNWEDIKHPTLDAISGGDYGRVQCYMRRLKLNADQTKTTSDTA